MPFPWKHEDLPAVQAELRARYSLVVSFLAGKLNAIHGVSRSERYWNLVVGPWAFTFLNLVAHHCASLKLAQANLGDLETIGLAEDAFITPRAPLDFLYEASDDHYNLQLYTRIAEVMGVRIIERRRGGDELRLSAHANPENLPKYPQSFARRVIARLLYEGRNRVEPLLASRARFLFRRSRLPADFEWKLVAATGGRIWIHGGPLYPAPGAANGSDPDTAMRGGLEGFAATDAIGDIVASLLPEAVPRIFLEEYPQLVANARAAYGAHEPKVVFSTVAWHYDVAFAHFAGLRSEQGALLVGGQEAGSFGVEANAQVEDFERSIADVYLTWGWTDPNDARCVPSTATRLVGIRERERSAPTGDILYVGTVALRYPVVARADFSNYFELQRRFFAAAGNEMHPEFRVRLHTADFGWRVKDRLVTAFPALNIEPWSRPFSESLASARLYICDHLSTTFTESFARNVPTILFWDPVFFDIRESARPWFDRLREVGIAHDSPESAASWASRVHEDVNEWWFDANTQQAAREFRHEFARTSATPLSDWLALLRRLDALRPEPA